MMRTITRGLMTAFFGGFLLVGCDMGGVNESIEIPDGTKEAEGATVVNGSIRVGDDATVTGDLRTVNGPITVGHGSRVKSLTTVNGSVTIRSEAEADDVETVNGGVELGEAARVNAGITTVNGEVELAKGASAGADVKSVNGRIELTGAEVAGRIVNSRGGIILDAGSRVADGLLIKQSDENDPEKDPVRVVIGPDSRVDGRLEFRVPVNLYVHESATIGDIEGAEPVTYDSDEPPRE